MNRDITWLVGPLVAIVVLAFVGFSTWESLRVTGAFGTARHAPVVRAVDPYTTLDAALGRPHLPSGAVRDPMAFGAAPVVAPDPTRPVVRRPVEPAAPARPQLTAIVYDTDPRALVRWGGREWTVRPGGLFDEFVVRAITRDQVTLQRGSETIVLQRPQGE